MLAMPMSIMDVVHVIAVLNSLVTAALAVNMVMILVNLAAHFQ